ncbi:class I histocompatibility antigen, F10 alpha chain-like isoform X1 [Neoarius graeffei]|uniref:class I histocompatibility antigen, F10 alpha chain-like isoform X1 n=2 Tax=Neoarius graeffei TaxID=443677 RepID=UPI00298CEC58|nr:class I histocompatibility antigen, F10 alpha chain-like isoform X1 [Neoarius graeffei]
MWKAKIIYTIVFFLLPQQSCCEVNSIIGYCLSSEGLGLPRYIKRVTVNDATVFYYDSNMHSTAPCPDWLSTTACQHWKDMSFAAQYNQKRMSEALQTAIKQFNLTGTFSDINVYQACSRCDLYPNGTVKTFLTHGFNGMDFLTLDFDSKTFIPSVPQAIIYKRIREKDEILLERVMAYYKKTCFDHLKMFLENSPAVNMKKAPEVRIFEEQRAGSTLLTCHVTGFYPKAVQVKWIGADLQQEDIETNDVLPNGDGTYQTRRSVIRPEENTGDQHYSCVVYHSSVEGNITVTWGKEEKLFRLPVWMTLVCIFMVTVVGLVIRCFIKSKDAVTESDDS